MTAPIQPTPASVPRRGRGLIIAGSIMIALSVVGGSVAVGLLGSRFDLNNWEDVAISGAQDRLVPGTIDFEILEPLDEGKDASMTVGIALSSNLSPAPDCSVEDAGGDAMTLAPIRSGEELLDWDGSYGDYELIGSTRLDVGEYRAVCEGGVESAAASGVSFTVGRILAVDDVTDQIGAVLGIFGAMGIAGLLFVVGITLLIVGLVQRSRSGRTPAPLPLGPYGQYPGQYPPGQYPPGQYPPGHYPPDPPDAPGRYGAPGHSPPGPYNAPDPYATPPGYSPPPGQSPQPGQDQYPPTPPPWPDAHPPGPPSHGPAAGPPDQSPDEDGTVSGWTVPPAKR